MLILPINENKLSLNIKDVTGKVILDNYKTLKPRINIKSLINSNLEKGVYFISVANGKSIVTKKLVIY